MSRSLLVKKENLADALDEISGPVTLVENGEFVTICCHGDPNDLYGGFSPYNWNNLVNKWDERSERRQCKHGWWRSGGQECACIGCIKDKYPQVNWDAVWDESKTWRKFWGCYVPKSRKKRTEEPNESNC